MTDESSSLQTPRPDGPSDVEQLRTLLYTDDLTGLYNRRFFRHCIEEQKSYSDGNHSPFALLIMDVDHFKQINDTYGHAVGDAALIRVARALKDQIKELGWVFRYAGDEFVALLRDCGEEKARSISGRVLAGVSTVLSDEAPDFPLRTLSLSIGIAIYPENGDGISSLFQAADRALYASKQGGRNCFHSVTELAAAAERATEWPVRIHCESLIGRQQPWSQLQHHFNECKAGRGRLLFVTGEAGIGKSRLLRQFTRRQRAGDYHILYGECTEGTIIHSYAPVRNALRKGFEAKDPATVNLYRGLEPHCRRELIALVPQFDRFEKEPLPPAPASDRYLLLESILLLIQAMSRQLPAVIVLEDIHWSDDATLNLLQYLARNVANERILLIATFREEDAVHSQLPAIIQNMSRENLFESIPLKPLNAEETAQMVEEVFQGYTTYLSFKQWVHEETEGIPFYIEELLKLLMEEGYIQRIGSEIEARKPDKFILPYSIRALVQRRINRLSEPLQRVLGFASIIGYEFDLQILVRLIEENEGYLLDMLEQLLRLQLIREIASPGEERFRFRHNKIRDVIYEEMGLIKRKKSHRRVAEILESTHSDELSLYSEELAYHFERGGVMKKAFSYSVEAGKKALQIHAYSDAQAHFDRCFRYGDLMDTSGIDLLAELYSGKGAVMEALGNWEDAVRCYNQLLALRRAGGARQKEAETLILLSSVYYMKEDFDKSREFALRALDLADRLGHTGVQSAAAYNLGKVYWRIGEYNPALEYMRLAVEKSAELKDDALRGKYLNSAGTVYLEKSDYSSALDCFQKANELFLNQNDRYGILECQVNFSILRKHQGSLVEARRQIREAMSLSQEIGDPYRIAVCAVNQAEVELELADYEQANRMNERAGRIYNELNHSLGQTHFLQNEARLHRVQANLEAALEAAYKARAIAEDRGLRHRAAVLMLEEGRIYFYKGDWLQCLDRIATARDLFQALKDAPGRIEAEIKLGFVYAAFFDPEKARAFWETAPLSPPESASLELEFWRIAAAAYLATMDRNADEAVLRQEELLALADRTGSAELTTISRIISAYQLQLLDRPQEALLCAEGAEQCSLQHRQELHLARSRMKRLELKRVLGVPFSVEEVKTLMEAARIHPQEDIVYRCLRLLWMMDPALPGLRDDRLRHWEKWQKCIPEPYHVHFTP